MNIKKVDYHSILKLLEEKGISPSFQRIKILEYLLLNRTHPSVEDIYRDLSSEILTLSKTTVYNTLKLFVEKGIVKTIGIEKDFARYDIDTSPHSHFKCIKCGKIYDLKISEENDSNIGEGFKKFYTEKYIYGVCKNCR
ncbi:MAG: Ferric uptake regulation protein [candidate division TA06 bacterium 32_111]|uniref:Ferric uptake regulation protein n=1 Tax=candidate division TA06 bacterium 34_109 TaxID=1635277 RepID=A0A101I2S1_UNCT6|nr:MAG: Ferric uptake regulation protein [candidate division TA06 bacterium 32_111]KUK87409.1 MAG: Ferric uptake regulation protein [candidate division TA06 bacterium 34_109]